MVPSCGSLVLLHNLRVHVQRQVQTPLFADPTPLFLYPFCIVALAHTMKHTTRPWHSILLGVLFRVGRVSTRTAIDAEFGPRQSGGGAGGGRFVGI